MVPFRLLHQVLLVQDALQSDGSDIVDSFPSFKVEALLSPS
jgi:hypothetical protein